MMVEKNTTNPSRHTSLSMTCFWSIVIKAKSLWPNGDFGSGIHAYLPHLFFLVVYVIRTSDPLHWVTVFVSVMLDTSSLQLVRMCCGCGCHRECCVFVNWIPTSESLTIWPLSNHWSVPVYINENYVRPPQLNNQLVVSIIWLSKRIDSVISSDPMEREDSNRLVTNCFLLGLVLNNSDIAESLKSRLIL